jgi:hypothetical protein
VSRRTRYLLRTVAVLVVAGGIVGARFAYKRATQPPLQEWVVGSWKSEEEVPTTGADGNPGKLVRVLSLYEFRSDGSMSWHTRTTGEGSEVAAQPSVPGSWRWEVLDVDGDKLTLRMGPPDAPGITLVFNFKGKDAFTIPRADKRAGTVWTYHRVSQP